MTTQNQTLPTFLEDLKESIELMNSLPKEGSFGWVEIWRGTFPVLETIELVDPPTDEDDDEEESYTFREYTPQQPQTCEAYTPKKTEISVKKEEEGDDMRVTIAISNAAKISAEVEKEILERTNIDLNAAHWGEDGNGGQIGSYLE